MGGTCGAAESVVAVPGNAPGPGALPATGRVLRAELLTEERTMSAYIARDKSGWSFLPEGSLGASRLDHESLRGPGHWYEAYEVYAGLAARGVRYGLAGDRRVSVYPEGGDCCELHVHGIGWVIDDEIPDVVYDALRGAAEKVATTV